MTSTHDLPAAPRPPSRSGFTLLELLVALTFFALVMVKVVVLLDATTKVTKDDASNLAMEDHARLTLDRIAYAIMGSDRGSLDPNTEAPAFSADIKYKVSLGVQNGIVVWDDPEQITSPAGTGDLFWKKNPGGANERDVVWSRDVAQLLEGEIANGIDDNGNGLIDEKGLTFVIDQNTVRIVLTLERPGVNGERPVPVTVDTLVTCRRPL